MTRKTLAWMSVAIAVAAASAWLTFWTSRVTRAQSRFWVPFEAVVVEKQYQKGVVAPYRIEDFDYARRSDGSWVEDVKKQIMPNGGWGDERIVMDYSTGKRVSIDPSTESVTSYQSSAKAIAQLSAPPIACSNDPNAKHVEVLGYDTVVVERILPGPTPNFGKVTDWEAPQLNCFPLQETAAIDGGEWSRTREALLVKEGDPPTELFEIPVSYVERAPSAVMAERARRFPADQAAQAAVSRSQPLDEAYRLYGKGPK
jgi:hypothetical protein